MENRRCSGCHLVLEVSKFNRNRTQVSGFSRYCKSCLKNCRGKRINKNVVCPDCGTEFLAKHATQVVCSTSCKSVKIEQNGETNPNWKGGVHISPKGYAYIRKPDHPNAMKSGYVKRATLVLSEFLGRPLSDNEMAHHINEDKLDDRLENLQLTTHEEHMRFHQTGSFEKKQPPPKVLLQRKDTSFLTSAEVSTRHTNVDWPSDEELLKQRATRTMQSIADSLGCSRVAVHKRLQKIQKSRADNSAVE